MRLIASFDQEKKAFGLFTALKRQGIDSVFEPVKNPAGVVVSWDVWIVGEDDFDKACEIVEKFYQQPSFSGQEPESTPTHLSANIPAKNPDDFAGVKIRATDASLQRVRMYGFFTRLLIASCIFIFFWTNLERVQLLKKYPSLGEYALFTPLTQKLLYDFPSPYQKLLDFFEKRPQLDPQDQTKWPEADRAELSSIENMPVWKGLYTLFAKQDTETSGSAPMFVKIQQGEVWRLVTPIFLHGNFLHILFNMLWLFLLGRELEIKIGKGRLSALVVLVALITNTSQYLMSGPMFLGFSGVICGLGGFIWTREKIAPWEGYSVPKGTLGFLLIFVLGMMVLQLIAFVISILNIGSFSVSGLGNTGHVVGLMAGCLLAKVPILYRLRG